MKHNWHILQVFHPYMTVRHVLPWLYWVCPKRYQRDKQIFTARKIGNEHFTCWFLVINMYDYLSCRCCHMKSYVSLMRIVLLRHWKFPYLNFVKMGISCYMRKIYIYSQTYHYSLYNILGFNKIHSYILLIWYHNGFMNDSVQTKMKCPKRYHKNNHTITLYGLVTHICEILKMSKYICMIFKHPKRWKIWR